MEACAKMGVPTDIRQLALPLGASFHKDGSVLGGVVKIAFLFGIFDLSLTTPGAFFACIGVAILCGTVMGAIPGGGMIGESLILSAFGLPMEALPLIVVIGTLIDPVATVLNSMGNIIVAMLTARWVEGAGWMDAAVKLD
jgi:Na+/H+-dicarboxylate symporter